MSDEPTPGQVAAPATTATAETPADAYGQPISAERQAELQGYLDRWQAEANHGDRSGPFDKGSDQSGKPRKEKFLLTGANVSWLAKQSGRDAAGRVPNLHLEGPSSAGHTWKELPFAGHI